MFRSFSYYAPESGAAGRYIIEHVCSCGWRTFSDGSNKAPENCPVCGAQRSWRTISLDRKSKKIQEQEVLQFTNKSFDIKMYRFAASYQKDNPVGSRVLLETENVFRTEVSLEPSFQITLTDKGQQLKPTKTNIKKALAYAGFYDLGGTIWKELDKIGYSAYDAVFLLQQYPVLEKLYNLDPHLKFFNSIRNHLEKINGFASRPHEAFGVNRSLFNTYMQAIEKEPIPFDKLRHLIDQVGEQKAEQILEKGILLVDTETVRVSYPRNNLITSFIELLSRDDVHFDPDTLANYLSDSIYTYQGISSASEGMSLLTDYLDMCESMGVTPEKYPRSLKLVHDLASKNHKIALDELQKKKFAEVTQAENYQSLVYRGKDYSVVAPENPDDLIHEGASLSHCVGSYVEKVINNGVKILFMRDNRAIDKPLLTIDVRDNELFFAAGFDNRKPTSQEWSFIFEWVDKKHIRNISYKEEQKAYGRLKRGA